MKLFVPEIGDILTLTNDWEFNLHHEYRNHNLIKLYNINYTGDSNNYSIVSLPADTKLKVDKINIRTRSGLYSFLTFRIQNSTKTTKKIQFWAKLKDVNRMDIENFGVSAFLKFAIKWDMQNITEKHNCLYQESILNNRQQTAFGKVDEKNTFEINVIHFKVNKRESYYGNKINNYVSEIKYELKCVLNNEIIGEWSTLTTMKKKAKEYINKNVSLFVDYNQKKALRVVKLKKTLEL